MVALDRALVGLPDRQQLRLALPEPGLPVGLERLADRAHDDRLQDAVLADVLGQLLQLGARQAAQVNNDVPGFYLAPALFILPYFLFSATAGQIAEKLEKVYAAYSEGPPVDDCDLLLALWNGTPGGTRTPGAHRPQRHGWSRKRPVHRERR